MMTAALQVAGGVGSCPAPLLHLPAGGRPQRRQVAAHALPDPARAVASAAVTEEEEGKVRLGGSGVAVTKLGIGAWSWGDTTYWNDSEWDERRLKEAQAAFDASIDNGMTFFDTAEVYGTAARKINQKLFSVLQLMGAVNSESLLGEERQRKDQVEVAVATKFAALPWRFGRGSVLNALKKSLDRLGLSSVELYQLHWPGIWGNEGYLDGLADAYEQGLVKAVGVSNYNEKRLRDAHARLKKRGVPLAANQVNYSLIYRTPELNGVKAACDELGITLIAYSPIAQGVLTGKYTPENPPTGPRANTYTPEFLTKLQPLMNRIKEIGGSYGKSPTQVALNWLTCQGNVVPIPGAKNASQAKEFAGALGWSLTRDEVEELRTLAREIKGIKMPIEES
ncbi:hypothetical protein EJB05_57392 [Eragrostis curvula]|uniref:NADP-dependent oxidoreductase domain-containing protein n=1 Tax=Eragrostis curvula TaxID=38414 RepID=A0A5J9SDJ4_9POAL|nr:hypothetical protein EJB05_57392 [Eragrostis curvula]